MAQGYSLREFRELPQLLSAFDADTLAAVRELFAHFAREFVEMEPDGGRSLQVDDEFVALHSVRHGQPVLHAGDGEHGVDFDRILEGCRHNYPRMAGTLGPGLQDAGPCLVKDTMQLAAFSHNSFVLGHAAMLINEGPPQSFDRSLARRDGEPRRTSQSGFSAWPSRPAATTRAIR